MIRLSKASNFFRSFYCSQPYGASSARGLESPDMAGTVNLPGAIQSDGTWTWRVSRFAFRGFSREGAKARRMKRGGGSSREGAEGAKEGRRADTGVRPYKKFSSVVPCVRPGKKFSSVVPCLCVRIRGGAREGAKKKGIFTRR